MKNLADVFGPAAKILKGNLNCLPVFIALYHCITYYYYKGAAVCIPQALVSIQKLLFTFFKLTFLLCLRLLFLVCGCCNACRVSYKH